MTKILDKWTVTAIGIKRDGTREQVNTEIYGGTLLKALSIWQNQQYSYGFVDFIVEKAERDTTRR